MQRTEAVFQIETVQMLLDDLLANILDNALDAALLVLRNGFVGLSWSNRFLRSTAPDSVGAVLAAS